MKDHIKLRRCRGLQRMFFDLDRSWMCGEENTRWLFAAMGLTIEMQQLDAFKKGRSTRNIKDQVLK